MRPPTSDKPLRAAPWLAASLALCLAGVVLFGAWPWPVLNGAARASQTFVTARQTVLPWVTARRPTAEGLELPARWTPWLLTWNKTGGESLRVSGDRGQRRRARCRLA